MTKSQTNHTSKYQVINQTFVLTYDNNGFEGGEDGTPSIIAKAFI